MKPRHFIGLLILDVINRFIFGHTVVILYVCCKNELIQIKKANFLGNLTDTLDNNNNKLIVLSNDY